VGIVNAINLIDGVNGLCSGYCITACFIFGTFFYCTHNVPMTLLAAVSAGALFPFFFHNVFGRTSRMFIGDGGTLVMGIVMAIFVCEVLRYDGDAVFGCGEQIPFTLAVLCIPVFDTLRVMSMRWWRGVSPFHPDKTHLHHLFIALGCSHPMTTAAILTLNSGVVFCWWVAAMLGASCEVQLYLVVGLSALFTFGLYPVLGTQLRRNTRFFHWLRWLGYHTHLSRTRFFLMFRNFVDKH
ncbi:MAG: undecaprenyl/decaprenyl-phosphate alpha-N-acetylglucosaminyl 1-phosphate transferase, partial [Alistipes sp.]|nr:undecaprenyl/decaprenyl-phosphate alpha-N-acetylglucosaminyl 1-phosphate transferase [Alistipes sp.]